MQHFAVIEILCPLVGFPTKFLGALAIFRNILARPARRTFAICSYKTTPRFHAGTRVLFLSLMLARVTQQTNVVSFRLSRMRSGSVMVSGTGKKRRRKTPGSVEFTHNRTTYFDCEQQSQDTVCREVHLLTVPFLISLSSFLF